MIFGVYSVRDKLTGYMTPIIDVNDQSAIRNFRHSIVNSTGVLSSACADFDFYRVGSFDSDSGLISSLPCPKYLDCASDALRFGPSMSGRDDRPKSSKSSKSSKSDVDTTVVSDDVTDYMI